MSRNIHTSTPMRNIANNGHHPRITVRSPAIEENLPTKIHLQHLEFNSSNLKATDLRINFNNFTPIYEGNFDKITDNLSDLQNDLSKLQNHQNYSHPLSKWIISAYVIIAIGFAMFTIKTYRKWALSRAATLPGNHQELPIEEGQPSWIP